MKKKILIVNKSFELGGIQMALANLLDEICDEYDITLAIFNPRGPFLERLPKNIRLLKLSPFTAVLGMTYADCKKYGSLPQRLFKITSTVWSKFFGNRLPISFALAFQKNVGDYDIAISYHQETTSQTMVSGFGSFALRKCNAKKRIAWIHADFLSTKLATPANLKTYRQFDRIVSVSRTAMDRFITAYPELKDKCDFCYNPVPIAEIVKNSNDSSIALERTEHDLVLFSACRLVPVKGLAPTLEKLIPIFTRHDNLKWYIAGAGPEGVKLQTLIKEHNLQNQVRLLGFVQNPYPYMKQADYLFVPSFHESFGMVVGEAHALGTPVIASDIPVMHEMLTQMDYLSVNNEYTPIIEKLMTIKMSKKTFPSMEWKEQFERVLEC